MSALEPGQPLPVEFEGGTFFVRSLSVRDTRQLLRMLRGVSDGSVKKTEMIDRIVEVVEPWVLGWENVFEHGTSKPLPYAPGDLDLAFDMPGLVRFVGAIQAAQSVRPDEAKK